MLLAPSSRISLSSLSSRAARKHNAIRTTLFATPAVTPRSRMASAKCSSISLRSFHFGNLAPLPPPILLRLKTRRPLSGPRVLLKSAMHWRANRSAKGICKVARSSGELTTPNSVSVEERPPFDINLAVVLAGFAFEAYTSPPKNVGWREVDTADCETVFLSKQFLREIYDGQLRIKLKKGVDLPTMDPWGTSDPYVVFQVEDLVAKSKVKWATKEPTWNEDLTLNIRKTGAKILQVTVWDANLVTPHKRMGNAGIEIESFCDGDLHEMVVELEGVGGGGKLYLEVIYKSYDEIEEDKQWWRMPFFSDFLMKTNYGSAIKLILGSEGINVSQFVQSAFGQLKTFKYPYLEKPSSSNSDNDGSEHSDRSGFNSSATPALHESSSEYLDGSIDDPDQRKELTAPSVQIDSEESSSLEPKDDNSGPPDEYFWRTFVDMINQVVHQKLGFSLPEIKVWDGFYFLHKASLQSRRNAEELYVESGLATPEDVGDDVKMSVQPTTSDGSNNLLLDITKVSSNVLSQTETIFGALMILTAMVSQQRKDVMSLLDSSSNDDLSNSQNENVEHSTIETGNLATERFPLDKEKAEEMRKLFSSAESAMEAWAMLATSLGRTSLIKSDFEKICFLDNSTSDTQVAIWRDSLRRRLVVAFRGTEQSKWKDLRTDLMLLPSGLNPERLNGENRQEVQVHSGFLNAYDSVRNRLMMLIKVSIGFESEDAPESVATWQIYVTGHSLGGALATLLALELSLSRMAKLGKISLTMYNFGSPRVGNRRFAELYNEKVKDSWRIVNHRDIIPTVPRLMGYCHVAQPVYLAAGQLKGLADKEYVGDGFQGDIIGEATPDTLVNEFLKGEKQLIEQILQTEINLLRSIRDGTALMQHMEDFYYITLLESVRSNYRNLRSENTNPNECSSLTA